MLGKEKNERAEGRLTFRAQVTQIANSELRELRKNVEAQFSREIWIAVGASHWPYTEYNYL